MNREFIGAILAEYKNAANLFKRNLIKEYLQIMVLHFIYSTEKYKNIFFYGGSCLKHCFGLPRLSEDLDFVDIKKEINLESLSSDLIQYFSKEIDIEPAVKIQKIRIYIKFPFLHELKLSDKNQSNILFLKIEVFDKLKCRKYKTEYMPIFKYNKSIIIKTFDLSTLLSTKLLAILFRKWEKRDRNGKTLIKVKGRDYFDLMWYLEKGVVPNYSFKELGNRKMLKTILLSNINKIDSKSIQLDLEPLIEDAAFIKNLSRNIKRILIKDINEKL